MKILLFVSLVATMMQAATARKKVIFLHTKVEFNADYFAAHALEIATNQMSLNVTMNVAQDFPHDLWAEIKIALREPKTKNYRNLLTYQLNICDIIGKDAHDKFNLAHIWVANFWKYGTLPKSCPILKGNYSWHGLKPEKFSIPDVMLNGRYRANINSYFRPDISTRVRTSLANITVYGQLS